MKVEIFDSDYIFNLDLHPETVEEVGFLLRLKSQYRKKGIIVKIAFEKSPLMGIQFKRKDRYFRKSSL